MTFLIKKLGSHPKISDHTFLKYIDYHLEDEIKEDHLDVHHTGGAFEEEETIGGGTTDNILNLDSTEISRPTEPYRGSSHEDDQPLQSPTSHHAQSQSTPNQVSFPPTTQFSPTSQNFAQTLSSLTTLLPSAFTSAISPRYS